MARKSPEKKQETGQSQPLAIFLYNIIPQETGKIIRLFSGRSGTPVQGGSELLQCLIPPFIDSGALNT